MDEKNKGLCMIDFKYQLEKECPELLNDGKISMRTLTKYATRELGMSYKKVINIK